MIDNKGSITVMCCLDNAEVKELRDRHHMGVNGTFFWYGRYSQMSLGRSFERWSENVIENSSLIPHQTGMKLENKSDKVSTRCDLLQREVIPFND